MIPHTAAALDELPLEVEDFLSWMVSERGRSPNTIAAYRRDLAGYTAWLREHGVDLADVAHRRHRRLRRGPSGDRAWRPHRSPASWPRCGCCTATS